ncbi:MAG: flagellar M-ring protein FliF [Nitrospiraceae bacterium]|nr:MAG: flagellar M-ring protein FliF [Nitrospiraceae bacterium]
MAAIDNIIGQIKAMPDGKKVALLGVLIASIASIFLLSAWIQKADYQVLFSGLSEDDAGRIVQELKDKKVDYQLSNSGTVMVPSDKVYDLRLQLASQGLPQGGGVGFEIFDNTSFTTSEFVQKLNYRRGLEGELARTIKSMSGVQKGRVHLVIPDKTLFAFQESKPKTSAAVFVTLQNGRKLDRAEVESIVHLVASSVEDLGADNITVIDNKGNLLTKPSDDSIMSMSGSQMEFQHNYEQNLISQIVSILEPVAGRGKVNARVSAAFDFTRSERTEEKFDPEGVVVRSEQKSTEKSTSGGGGGVPGVASNLPGGGAQPAASMMGQSQKQDEMINYETSKTVTRVIQSPVSLERLSVAIIIDGILASQKGTSENADKYTVRSDEDLKYYEDIVKKTIGFSGERGDEISVNIMPFNGIETAELPDEGRDYMPIVMSVLKYLVPGIVVLVFFLVVVRPLVASLSRSIPQAAGKVSLSEEQAMLESSLQAKEIPLEKQVIDWANTNPQQAAGLVKGWLEE